MDSDERRTWHVPEPLETRWDALTDLHDGTGTRWVKDPTRGYWADCCDRHRPAEIIDARRAETANREAAERALAAQRQRPYHPPEEPEPVAEPEIPPEAPRRFGFLLRRRP